MKTRPILMNTFSVRAIKDARKKQTRRVIKPQPRGQLIPWFLNKPFDNRWIDETLTEGELQAGQDYVWHCPYGIVGDHLWVRETWAVWQSVLDEVKAGYMATQEALEHVLYKADFDDKEWKELHEDHEWTFKPSIFMPRWAGRITLEIKSERAEEIQSISQEDIFAEGINELEPSTRRWCPLLPDVAKEKFIQLWDSINAKKGHDFASNRWVWMVEFKRIGNVL